MGQPMNPQEKARALRAAAALIQGARKALLRLGLSDYGVSVVLHPASFDRPGTKFLAADSTLSSRAEMRAVFTAAVMQSLEIDGVSEADIPEVASEELKLFWNGKLGKNSAS